ncbi:DUF305 domain-containing protein [Rubrobacter taiwanensis]|uniref:DUF305 domain-containing protein n=1 Tax=Rubrobacter taiwanensis TaxID=185139 RepID=A0A4R1BE07_9ACTN|nr:DUF305 domain-containing protein [Rubrobacter taiwanensis]TCJ15294.1 DUF305 domain-containing protein [Rubrobacter taiwanensis]
MKLYPKLGLLALLLAAALALAACGNGAGEGMQDVEPRDETTGGMHEGMDHGEMGHGEMESMLLQDGEYSDERFIDLMVPHHRGAVEMAEVALENAEHGEIRQLSRNIISSQQAEIEELKDIKEREYGTREVPMEMSEEEMRMMGMEMSPEELARQEPFDLAFIEHMIPHHQSAIDMAEIALKNSENEEIRTLARNIIEEQQAEIEQMQQWREEWYRE